MRLWEQFAYTFMRIHSCWFSCHVFLLIGCDIPQGALSKERKTMGRAMVYNSGEYASTNDTFHEDNLVGDQGYFKLTVLVQ